MMRNEHDRDRDPQVTVTGRIRQTQVGEAIVFEVSLLFFKLVCIVNIPGENETEAPVYVRFSLDQQRNKGSRPQVMRRRPRYNDEEPANGTGP